MLLRRACAAAVGAAFAVGVAGCGGAAKTGVSSQPGASLVRAGALAYVAVDGDLSSNQWKTVDKLSKKFPIRDQALTALRMELSKQNLSYKDDIKPALGSEVDVAVVAGATLAQTSYAVLTKPDDAAKYKALVRKLSR